MEALTQKAKRGRKSEFRKFGERYFADPVAFARDCVRWPKGRGLTTYQKRIMAKVPEKRRVCARTPRGAGKSAFAAQTVLWFGLTREALGIDWKCVCTAGVGSQLRNYFWPEVKRWARILNWDVIGREEFNLRSELLTDALHLMYGRAFCVAPEEPQKIEGAHAQSLLVVLDESKMIPEAVFDAVEGMFSGAGEDSMFEAFALMISTPGGPNGRFYEVQSRKPQYKDWWTEHVELHEMLDAKMITPEFIEMRKQQWGASSALFLQHVEGKFAADETDALIPLAWVEAAFERGEDLI